MQIVTFICRRRFYLLITFCVGLLLTAVVTVSLDSLYQSSATMIIERQLASKDLLNPALGGLLEEQFESNTKIVLSRKNLGAIIEALDVYPDLKQKMTPQRLVEKMREDVVLERIKDDRETMSMGRQPSTTLMFVLRFKHTNPKTAAQVVDALAKLFLKEDESTREAKALSRLDFLSDQLEENQREVEGAERRITQFKEEHLLSLPQLMDVNMKAMDDIQREIKIKEIQLVAARDRVIYLEGQLAIIPPNQKPYMSDNGKILSMEDQLEALRSQYLNLKATHSEQHPDVVRLRRQVAALDNASSLSGQLQQLSQRLEEKETSRSLLLERLSPEHPDVGAVERDIRAVREEINLLVKSRGGLQRMPAIEPDNPIYVSMLTQLESAKLESASLEKIIRELTIKLGESLSRIEQMPHVEQEFLTMQRHYNYLLSQHQEHYDRYQEARETASLELQNIGEVFKLIDPPIVAEKPIKPNRLLLFILGMMFSLGIAGSVGITAEYLDHSIHTSMDLVELTGAHVLGSIPAINVKQKCRKLKLLQRS